MNSIHWLIILLNLALKSNCQHRNGYYGTYIGSFPGTTHNVKGSVYAATEDTIYIRGFSYDGAGPDAFFWAGTTPDPSTSGFIIPDELGRVVKLNSYNNQNVMLKLPGGRTFRDIRWISVWCRLFQANFGHVSIPPGFTIPQERNLGRIPTLAHRTRADAVIVKNAKTLFIQNLHYDGAAPDAFFLVGKGDTPHKDGIKVPDENGSLRKLHGYRGQNITLRLPNNLTIFDIDWFSLFCITYRENFGNIKIPKDLNVPADLQELGSEESSFPNCETIFPELLQVSWEVRHPDIYIQMEGKVEPDKYISFGLSGNSQRAQMVGSDVTVAFYDSSTQSVKIVDYILTAKAQCAPQSKSGACPDEVIGGRQNSEMIFWNYHDGILKAAYKRRLNTRDDNADQEITAENEVTIVAAIGPINSRKEVAFHNIKYTKATDRPMKVLFDRITPQRNCHKMLPQTSNEVGARLSHRTWRPAVIEAPNNQAFRVVIGPAGGDRGYTSITGVQSWGIAYWVDDKLIPEIHVKRGNNYTFVVEAGDNPAQQARYHPLYITNNREGGGGQRPEELNTTEHRVYAGIKFDRNNIPDPSPGAGRYCELLINGIDRANESNSIEEYYKTLNKVCDEGNSATFIWSPDENTPDVVYYQCFTHRNLGWKIIVNFSTQTNINTAAQININTTTQTLCSHYIQIFSIILLLINYFVI